MKSLWHCEQLLVLMQNAHRSFRFLAKKLRDFYICQGQSYAYLTKVSRENMKILIFLKTLSNFLSGDSTEALMLYMYSSD